MTMFLMYKIDFESPILALFDTSLLHQFSKFNNFLWACKSLSKGILKCLFGVFTFFQNTKENKSTSSKGKFVCSIFGRTFGLKKSFQICLTCNFVSPNLNLHNRYCNTAHCNARLGYLWFLQFSSHHQLLLLASNHRWVPTDKQYCYEKWGLQSKKSSYRKVDCLSYLKVSTYISKQTGRAVTSPKNERNALKIVTGSLFIFWEKLRL